MNNLPQIKRDLIASMDQRRAETRAFVETLPPELPVHKDSDWTVRDLIIHLTALEADMISALHSAIEGKAFSVDLRGTGLSTGALRIAAAGTRTPKLGASAGGVGAGAPTASRPSCWLSPRS